MRSRKYHTLLLALASVVVSVGFSRQVWSDLIPSGSKTLDARSVPRQGLRSELAPSSLSLLRAALLAGGCAQRGAIDHYETVFAKFFQAHGAALAACRTERRRGELLLHSMHTWFLASPFLAHEYRLDKTLDGASHNCLTSAILYICLCRSAGLPAQAVAGPSHVYCRIHLDSLVDVQTTSPGGFSLGVSGADVSGVGTDPSGEELDDYELLARVYYNRGTSLLVQHEPGRALRFLQQSDRLDPHNRVTQRNLLVAWNDSALQLCDQCRFSASAAALQSCLLLDPQDSTALANDIYVHHQWVSSLCERRRYDEAARLLETCFVRRPKVTFFDQGRWVIYRLWAESCARIDDWTGAHHVFTLASQRHPADLELRATESEFWAEYSRS